LRELFVKTSRGLLTLTTIGILSIVLGFLYFSGVASSDRMLFGFDYKLILAFGFYLTIMTLLPALSVLDARGKANVKKIYPHLILLICLSILGLIYSLLVYGVYVPPIDSVDHSWFDYFALSSVVLVLSFTFLLFGVRDRERLWNLKYLFLLLIFIGIIIEGLSMAVYGQYLELLDIEWQVLFFIGGFSLFLGFFPLLISDSVTLRNFLNRTLIIWVLGVLAGIVLVALAFLINTEILEASTFLDIEWFAFFSFGSLLLLSSTGLLSSSRKANTALRKLRFLWIIVLLIGVILVIISFVYVPNDFLDYSWDLYYMLGVILSFLGLFFLSSVAFFETEEVSGDFQASGVPSDSFLDLKTTQSEMATYLEILGKGEASLINQFKEALREDKFRPRVYESLVKHYEGRIKSYKTKINSLRKAKPGTPQADKVGALFDSILGETPSTAPSTPSAPSTPAPKAPSAPTAPPPPPSTGPAVPSPPPSTPPVPPVSAPTPTPPPPSESIVSPGQPSESPLDLIADARSTSIAELRGEMLKELRRLREIFKEE
jgi:hypothetical protein